MVRVCKNGHAIDYSSRCKLCMREASKKQKLRNPEAHKKRSRKSKLKKFGLTIEMYDLLAEAQNHVCKICSRKESIRLAVDHCHKTGRVRGLLCGKCNKAVGLLDDDVKLLYNAIRYLKSNSGSRDPDQLDLLESLDNSVKRNLNKYTKKHSPNP